MSGMERAFLAAIIADPDDDVPRLVYADWLEMEGGQEDRARWIRAHIAFARSFYATRRQQEAKDEMLRLMGTGPPQPAPESRCRIWQGPPGWVSVIMTGQPLAALEGVSWWRGFVKHVRCPLAEWLERGPGIAAAHPLESVECPDVCFARDTSASSGWTRLRIVCERPRLILGFSGMAGDVLRCDEHESPGLHDLAEDAHRAIDMRAFDRDTWKLREQAKGWFSDALLAWARKTPLATDAARPLATVAAAPPPA